MVVAVLVVATTWMVLSFVEVAISEEDDDFDDDDWCTSRCFWMTMMIDVGEGGAEV